MNVHYTGRQVELNEAQKRRLEKRFDKVQRILGNRDQPEAHVIVSTERRRYFAEVTLNYRHHTLVVECAGADLFQVAQEAVEKIEKQIIRDKDRFREKKRRPGRSAGGRGGAGNEAPARS